MEESYKNLFRGLMFLTIVVLLLLILSIVLSGCRTIEVTKEVPVITEKVTERDHVDIVRDTLMMRDSIYHYVQGDTVVIERWHHTVNVNKMFVADTIRDTIPKVITITRTEVKEVNFLHWWQKALMWAGAVAFVALFIIIFIKR